MNSPAETENRTALFAREEQAKVQIERLETLLVDAEAEAERTRLAFERTPAPASHTAKEVAAQKAKNAASALTAAREEHRATFEEAASWRKRDNIADLCQRIEGERRDEIKALLEDNRRFIVEFVDELRVRLDGLSAAAREHNDLINHLERLLPRGEKSNYGRVCVERLLEQLSATFSKTHGQGPPYEHHRSLRFVYMADNPNEHAFTFEFRQPCSSNWRYELERRS